VLVYTSAVSWHLISSPQLCTNNNIYEILDKKGLKGIVVYRTCHHINGKSLETPLTVPLNLVKPFHRGIERYFQNMYICSKHVYMFKTCIYVQNMSICSKHVYMFKTCLYVQNMSICSKHVYMF